MDRPKILIIENDEPTRTVVRQLFESEGYQVETFADGKPALERLQQRPETCLIFLDLLMPVMNGWEFMKEFLKLPVTIVPTPVYLFSVTKEVEGDTKKMGAVGFVKKPVNFELMLRIVEDHCKKPTAQAS